MSAIRNCPCIACPNHAVRPYQVKVRTEKQAEDGSTDTVLVDRAKKVTSEERLQALERARAKRREQK